MLTEIFGVGMSRKPTQFHLCVVREQTIALINDEINGSNFSELCWSQKKHFVFVTRDTGRCVCIYFFVCLCDKSSFSQSVKNT